MSNTKQNKRKQTRRRKGNQLEHKGGGCSLGCKLATKWPETCSGCTFPPPPPRSINKDVKISFKEETYIIINRVIPSQVYGWFLKWPSKFLFSHIFCMPGKEDTWCLQLRVQCKSQMSDVSHTQNHVLSKHVFFKAHTCPLDVVNINMVWSKVKLFILEIWLVLFKVCQSKHRPFGWSFYFQSKRGRSIRERNRYILGSFRKHGSWSGLGTCMTETAGREEKGLVRGSKDSQPHPGSQWIGRWHSQIVPPAWS